MAMDKTVQLKDEKARIFYTLESIKHWLKIAPKNQLIICDGSGYDFSSIIHEHFPCSNIECLFFTNNVRLVEIHGKGFGEGEIIRYALRHSRILSESSNFAKCTAKLWVDNFQECIHQWNGQFLCNAFFSNVFSYKQTKLEFIDTRFYMADINFYKKFFEFAHSNVGGNDGYSIEDRFLEIIQKEQMQRIIFSLPPFICGVGGGSGKYYKSSIMRRTKDKIRTNLVAKNSQYVNLFI